MMTLCSLSKFMKSSSAFFACARFSAVFMTRLRVCRTPSEGYRLLSPRPFRCARKTVSRSLSSRPNPKNRRSFFQLRLNSSQVIRVEATSIFRSTSYASRACLFSSSFLSFWGSEIIRTLALGVSASVVSVTLDGDACSFAETLASLEARDTSRHHSLKTASRSA